MKLPPHIPTACILLFLPLSSCTPTIVGGTAIHVQGAKLRKTVAFKTQILQCGNKVSTGVNSFASYDFLNPAGKVTATVSTSMKVEEVCKWLYEIGLSDVPNVTKADGSLNRTSTESGTFVVVAIQNKKPLLQILQAKENAALVDRLSKMKKPRIITAIATTLGQKSIKTSALTGSATANLSLVGAGAGSTTLKATNNRNSTVEFSDGTVFAYEMSIPAWQRDTAGKVYIVDYVEDRPGAFNPKPIGGSFLNLSDAAPVPEDQILLAR